MLEEKNNSQLRWNENRWSG